jgi:hypothetical protein
MPSRSAAFNGASPAHRQDGIPTALESGSLFNWRAHLPVHPAAELFPLMKDTDPAGFKELVSDIEVNGLRTPIILFGACGDEDCLIDGRNRLDALASLGLLGLNDNDGRLEWKGRRLHDRWDLFSRTGRGHDPYAIVLSLNAHRRHLNAEQKRDVTAKVLKAKHELSDRAIAKQVKIDHKTVGTIRAGLEARGEIPHVEKRKDTKGREQPARRKGKAGKKSNSVAKSDSATVTPAPIEAATDAEAKAKVETKVTAAAPEASAEPIDCKKIIELAGQARALLKHPTPSNVESVKGLLTKITRLCTKPTTTKIIRAPEEKKPASELKIDFARDILGLEGNKVVISAPSAVTNQPAQPVDLAIPNDLSIPRFMDRRPPPEPAS